MMPDSQLSLPLDGKLPSRRPSAFAEGAWLLPGFAAAYEPELSAAVAAIAEASPWRHMETPRGHRIQAATTSCGAWGWVSDRRGYRYEALDPCTGRPWPGWPPGLLAWAQRAAAAAGYEGFVPNSCLLNRYAAGASMGWHRDADESDATQPIVSFSLGASATFFFGGLGRGGATQRMALYAGDVVVFGGPSRLCYHRISAPQQAEPQGPTERINLTLRFVASA